MENVPFFHQILNSRSSRWWISSISLGLPYYPWRCILLHALIHFGEWGINFLQSSTYQSQWVWNLLHSISKDGSGIWALDSCSCIKNFYLLAITASKCPAYRLGMFGRHQVAMLFSIITNSIYWQVVGRVTNVSDIFSTSKSIFPLECVPPSVLKDYWHKFLTNYMLSPTRRAKRLLA